LDFPTLGNPTLEKPELENPVMVKMVLWAAFFGKVGFWRFLPL